MNYLIKFLILGVGLLAAGPVLAASIYVYVGPKGDRLITDHLRNDLAGYRLLKKYTADDDFGSPSGPAWSGEVSPRKSRYDALIQSKAQQFGIEAALLKAMIHVESAFNPNAVSPKGAGGLMQLMPATAARYWVSTITAYLFLTFGFALFSCWCGLILSFYFPDVPSGPAIILVAGVIFFFSLLFAPQGIFPMGKSESNLTSKTGEILDEKNP